MIYEWKLAVSGENQPTLSLCCICYVLLDKF